ncbi:HlyD family secretion protein [Oryzomicrobium terrae]|uniref:HlyD family secretion protein n=1 Tax=Oryzomicrobium terrae TaxID=1735038 RepID=A0A5C1E5B2_9RHOO|nr:HlyD family efflux transporter periplasmic adaptor subunit [Oryzomicrobium terrae]QEL63739.1 HlyD family secretion protein [Oryzomicrobium terrae]
MNTRKLWLLGGTVLAASAAFLFWQSRQVPELPPGFAQGNGRIEATEIDVSTKAAGRVKEVLVREGDFVTAGQEVARMDTEALDAQLQQAQAQVRQAESTRTTTQALVAQRESAKAAAEAVVAQRRSELAFADGELRRSQTLVAKGFLTPQKLDADRAKRESAAAALAAAKAQVVEAKSGIAAARSQVVEAQSAIEAAKATVARLEADKADSVLVAPRDGRVQYRVAEPGEVLGAGGKVVSLIDLTDVYMTLFLPETLVGKLAIGAEARIVLDAVPQYVIPAQVSFVASEAQFTPKTVETAVERQKLVFRVKARIDPDLLRQHMAQVKTGLPGVTTVRLAGGGEWPDHLAVHLPQ